MVNFTFVISLGGAFAFSGLLVCSVMSPFQNSTGQRPMKWIISSSSFKFPVKGVIPSLPFLQLKFHNDSLSLKIVDNSLVLKLTLK